MLCDFDLKLVALVMLLLSRTEGCSIAPRSRANTSPGRSNSPGRSSGGAPPSSGASEGAAEAASVLASWRMVAATWPSAEQLRHLPLFWDDAMLGELRGTYAGARIGMLRTEAADIFDSVVARALGGDRAASFCADGRADGDSLQSTFRHALSLVISRGLERDYGSVDATGVEGGGRMVDEVPPTVLTALVELFNGLPEGEDLPLGCNVELFSDLPFAHPNLRQRCPWPARKETCARLECSVIQAKADVRAGEELLFACAPSDGPIRTPPPADAPTLSTMPVVALPLPRAWGAPHAATPPAPHGRRRLIDGRLSAQVWPRAARRDAARPASGQCVCPPARHYAAERL